MGGQDSGGQIGAYLEKFQKIRETGQQVVIDGNCLSACTLVLGVIPAERICVTRTAVLGFHAAWNPDYWGGKIQSEAGSALVMRHYPPKIVAWIKKQGGLNDKMSYLYGRELTRLYPVCN